MRLSKNFTLAELLRSDIALRDGIHEQYTPSKEVLKNLQKLVEKTLQPLRTAYGRPLTVNSGYRCERLNSHPEVKGANNSDHLRGMAADITCDDPHALYRLAETHIVPFRQLIYYPKKNFVHISFNEYDLRGQKWVQQ